MHAQHRPDNYSGAGGEATLRRYDQVFSETCSVRFHLRNVKKTPDVPAAPITAAAAAATITISATTTTTTTTVLSAAADSIWGKVVDHENIFTIWEQIRYLSGSQDPER